MMDRAFGFLMPVALSRINASTNAFIGNYSTVGTKFAFDGKNMWMLVPGGFARLNNSGSPADTYNFVNGIDGTDITFDGTEILAANNTFFMTVQVASLAPLPVKFTLLNSSCTGSSVVINWKAEGNQTTGFVLQRSINGRNGSRLEECGTILPALIQFTDKNIYLGALYRISEIETSGQVLYERHFKTNMRDISPLFHIS
jgi:hypothetical protein